MNTQVTIVSINANTYDIHAKRETFCLINLDLHFLDPLLVFEHLQCNEYNSNLRSSYDILRRIVGEVSDSGSLFTPVLWIGWFGRGIQE